MDIRTALNLIEEAQSQELGEKFLHGFKPSYMRGDKPPCEIYENPNRDEWKRCKGNREDVRAFLVGPNIIIWNTGTALHQSVRDELNLDNEVISLVVYGTIGDEAGVMVTDNVRNTPWDHNGQISDVIQSHPFMMNAFTRVDVAYYDEDIVGDWATMDDEDEEEEEEDEDEF